MPELQGPAPPPAPPRRRDVTGSYGGYVGDGYGGYQGPRDAAAEAQAHLVDYVRVVYKHRWVAVTTFVVLFLFMVIRTFSTVPVYEARVQLQLDPETPSVMSFKEGADAAYGYGYEDYYYQTQYTILKSRGLARRTLTALNLWESAEFGGGKPGATAPAPDRTVAALAWLKGLVGASPPAAPPPTRDAAETARQAGIVDAMLGGLSVVPVRNSRLVDVRYESTDPAMAATIANGLAKEYISQNLEQKFLSTKEAADWLGQQLTQERKKLEASEQALQRYRETGDAVALEDRQNIVVQRLTDLNAAYTKARTDRLEKEALYNQLSSLQKDLAALDTFPAILSNTFIQQLKAQLADMQRQEAQLAERLGDKHPEMIKQRLAIETTEARLAGEIAKVVQSVRNEYLSAQAQERSLAEALNSQKTDALSLDRRGIEYGVLRREAESNRQIYDLLMQRAKETGISGQLKTNNIRIVDAAETPRRPVRPDTRRDVTLGLLAGLVAGIGLAFFVEYLDNRIKNPDEIKQFLELGFLGLVPALSAKEMSGATAPLVTEVVPQSFAEAFRAVRTNVLFSSAAEGSRSVLVTSTEPQEGKTVVASNLAVTLAQTGQRVALIDADLRKPRQHDLFGISQDPGLSSVLVGKARASEAMKKTTVGNLWIMPAGPNPPNPAELLMSKRFQDLINALRGHFDWIVLDSPPVMAVTDASLIGHLTTGVVFVIASEQVNRNTVLRAVEQLKASKATILGAVLNRVNIRRNPYYYAHYYKHDYAGYYSEKTPV